jgi:hypothetical protein
MVIDGIIFEGDYVHIKILGACFIIGSQRTLFLGGEYKESLFSIVVKGGE